MLQEDIIWKTGRAMAHGRPGVSSLRVPVVVPSQAFLAQVSPLPTCSRRHCSQTGRPLQRRTANIPAPRHRRTSCPAFSPGLRSHGQGRFRRCRDLLSTPALKAQAACDLDRFGHCAPPSAGSAVLGSRAARSSARCRCSRSTRCRTSRMIAMRLADLAQHAERVMILHQHREPRKWREVRCRR